MFLVGLFGFAFDLIEAAVVYGSDEVEVVEEIHTIPMRRAVKARGHAAIDCIAHRRHNIRKQSWV